MSQRRHSMRSKEDHYVEAMDRETLVALRARDPRFKYCRITECIQFWDDLVKVGVVYPPEVRGKTEFIEYNRRR